MAKLDEIGFWKGGLRHGMHGKHAFACRPPALVPLKIWSPKVSKVQIPRSCVRISLGRLLIQSSNPLSMKSTSKALAEEQI